MKSQIASRYLRSAVFRLFPIIVLVALIASSCNLASTPTPLAPTETPLPTETALPTATNTPLPPTPLPKATETTMPPTATETVQPTPASLVIQPQNAEELQRVNEIQQGGAQAFAWLPGSESLAMATDQQVALFSLVPASEAASVNTTAPKILTASPDQKILAWADPENLIHLWSLPNASEIASLKGSTAAVTSLSFSPQGSELASATFDNKVNLWDTANGELLKTWDLPYWLSNLSYSPDGSQVGGADLQNFTVHILNASTGEEVRSLNWSEHASPALYGAVFSPDWKQLAWFARGTVQLMDVASGEMGPTLSHEDFVNDIAWSPDGSLLASASAATVNGDFVPVVIVWDTVNGQPIKTLVQQAPILSLSFSPNGRELATLNSDGALQLWGVAK